MPELFPVAVILVLALTTEFVFGRIAKARKDRARATLSKAACVLGLETSADSLRGWGRVDGIPVVIESRESPPSDSETDQGPLLLHVRAELPWPGPGAPPTPREPLADYTSEVLPLLPAGLSQTYRSATVRDGWVELSMRAERDKHEEAMLSLVKHTIGVARELSAAWAASRHH